MRTIVDRKPRIIAQVMDANRVSLAARDSLLALAREIQEGMVSSPFAGREPAAGCFENEERSAWEREIEPHLGKSWLELPWYFAEAFFYLKLLFAFGYFDVPANPLDPFAALKEEELVGPDGGLETGRLATRAVHGLGDAEALTLLLHSALWGNRADLSNFDVDETRRNEPAENRGSMGFSGLDRKNLLVDHTESAVDALRSGRIFHVILDNAGPELVCDLLLVERLLRLSGKLGSKPGAITLHAKRMPFFVSDAMSADVTRTIEALAADHELGLSTAGRRLREAMGRGVLLVSDHWFWSSPLHFTRFPESVRADLAGADLVLVKGDANYRRLLEDRKWETWRGMEELTSYFPAPFVALRTMKSEIVVDVSRERARELSISDPQWLIDGRRGIIRHCARTGASR